MIPLPWIVQTRSNGTKETSIRAMSSSSTTRMLGGHHLRVTIVYPIFIEDEMLLFPAMRAHWADVGGMTPGSISGQATEIYQEGLRIPPIKLYEKGAPVKSVMDLMFSNMRLPEQRRGDLRGMVGTCHTAEKRIREIVDKYGRLHPALHGGHSRPQRRAHAKGDPGDSGRRIPLRGLPRPKAAAPPIR